jgi:hypothetical protein
MEELALESIRGSVGTLLLREFKALADQMDEAVVNGVRKSEPYGELRYRAGVADGLRAAANLIIKMKEQ